MTQATELRTLLEGRDPRITEQLIAFSAINRLGDIQSLRSVFDCVDGIERGAGAFGALADALAGGSPHDDARLRSPVLRGWLSDFGRIADWTNVDDPNLLRQLDKASNMQFSLSGAGEWTALLAVEDGVLMTADCALAIAGIPGTLVGAQKSGNRLALVDEDGLRHDFDLADHDDPRVLRAPSLDGLDTLVRNDLPWLRLSLREGAVPTREAGVVPWQFDAREPYYARTDTGLMQEAAAMIEACWPERHREMGSTVRVLVPRVAPPGWKVEGFTVSSHQGAIWIFPTRALDVFESIIHEEGHIRLRYIEEAIPILAPDQTDKCFPVSWREDPRPIVGIVEGVFVHSQIASGFARALDRGVFTGAARDEAEARLAEVRREVAEAVQVLHAHGKFTPAGEGFLDWADAVVAQGETVSV